MAAALELKVETKEDEKVTELVNSEKKLTEEKIASARLDVGVTKDGHICSMQKGGKEPLTKDDILFAVNLAVTKTKELIEHL